MATHRVGQGHDAHNRSLLAQAFTEWLVARACVGMPPLESAHALAARFPTHGAGAYADAHAAAEALVRREMGKSFTAGFATGFAGLLALPVALPAGMAASFLLQARMAAAIAILFGHDPQHPAVRTTILLSLEAGYAPEALRHVGSKVGRWAATQAVRKLSPAALLQLNERVGARLLGRATRNRVAFLGRAVPVVGAIVAGGTDAYGCRRVAREALTLFAPAPN